MTIENILKTVSKPGRYTGGELSQTIKNKADVRCRWAFCFPDTYEIGMSNLGMKLLYGALNREPDVWCERCFAPWTDMEEKMRKYHIPLWALESGDPLKDFDVISFSLGYELSYSNVLYMLDLAGIPLSSKERGEDDPIIAAGGCCVYNPEPLADFIDIFSIGEGEAALPELARLYIRMKEDGSY
ncbi:MAG: B12-binding domain-containing radical SAM protein, partial [Clostridia bacterium]|nr:B12-binding domain-containing radical SAM protein [Clostridia bacterium]